MVVAALLVGLAACTADADDDGDGSAGLDEDVAEDLRAVVADGADGQTGGMVAWIDTPDEDLAMAAGVADLATGKELTGDEAFRIASITKLFTATVALQLVEEGRLDLDEPVAEVIPEQAGRFEDGEEVTLRHLLEHASGLPDYVRGRRYFADRAEEASIDDGPPAAMVTASCAGAGRDWLGYAAAQRQTFPPGTKGQYSNTNYLLVGLMLEAVTGGPLEEAYRERILAPLDMDDTWLACAERPRADLAHGYSGQDRFAVSSGDPAKWVRQIDAELLDVTGFSKSVAWADGALASTGEDLAVFARALFTGELFDHDATLTTMLESGPLEPRPGASYGLGVELEDDVWATAGTCPDTARSCAITPNRTSSSSCGATRPQPDRSATPARPARRS